MCGICGFNWRDEALADRMAESIAHRGPDQRGVFSSDRWSLGHRRLSIIDLSEYGRQPMSNEDGTIQIVFNGEIFNFADIKDDLVKKGHQFIGHSDTEVIVHGYEEYGVDVVRKLRGMFGIAIVDLKKNRLLLARDRLGIKPIYYFHKGGKIIFASEIKAIIEDPTVPRRLNRQALYDYLGFEFVPAPETMFEDIYKLPAGHTLLWENGRAEVKPYWDLTYPSPGTPAPSEGEVIERIRYLLDDCVKYWLVSDVPVAAFLSGGLDSSCIVAFMRKHIPGKLQTFTIGYPDKTFSELDYAKVVADRFGTEHSVLMISDLSEELVEKSIWHLDEPMTDLSSIPLMLICREARKSVKVCMSGEGGDEVFCGYDRFKASKINQTYNLLPRVIREQIVAKFVMRLRDRPEKKGPVNLLKRFIEGSLLPADGRHLRWQYFLNPRFEDSLFGGAFKGDVKFDPFAKVREYDARCSATDRLNRELYLDTRYEMADSVLMKVDKMSMSCALEVRVPLLDHELVEYMATVPGNRKLSGFQTKAVFRKALRGFLPESIIHRGKQGYSLPVKHLLRGRLKDYMIKLLNETPVIRDNMNMRFVNQLIREHLEMKHNHNHILWGLMNTAIWHRKFFRG
jgi:asparagine synthase (glutamine-hydrolysing)